MRPWTFARWLQRHRRLARIIPRRVSGWIIWHQAMRDPAFVAGMEQGMADVDAGRMTLFEHVIDRLEYGKGQVLGD